MQQYETVSVVIPCYYSEKTISTVVELTRRELVELGFDYQFVLVNDGSTDKTFSEISRLAREDDRVLGINLSKNFGQNNALMAGLHYVTGDVVVGMDDDLQTHPSQLPRLLCALDDKTDLVYGVFPTRTFDNLIRKLGSKFERWTLQVLGMRPKGVDVSAFWAAKKYVCDEAKKYQGSTPSVSSLMLRATGRVKDVPIEHHLRAVGSSGYTIKKLIKTYLNLLSFSVVPLRIIIVVGAALSIISLVSALWVLISSLLSPSSQAGWSSLMVTILFATGMIILCLGIIGEYLARIFLRLGSAPQYIVRETTEVLDDSKEK